MSEELRRKIEDHVMSLTTAEEVVDLRKRYDPRRETPQQQTRLSMDEPIASAKLMVMIVYNLFISGAKMTAATWRALFAFERDHGDRSTTSDLWRERAFSILYVVSKVDMVEFERVSDVSFNIYFSDILYNLTLIVSRVLGAGYVSDQKADRGKTFLKSPAIILALTGCLGRALRGHRLMEDVTDERIRSIIDQMNICAVDRLGYLRGVTVRDGVVMNSDKLNQFQGIKYEANFFTVLMHETAHFVVRRLVNNFAFTSPIKYEEADGLLTDSKIGSKGLEMGRHCEISILGMQPNWKTSTWLAAYLFRRRAFRSTTRTTLPLISRIEGAVLLKKRPKASVSMACDFSDSLPQMSDIGC